MRTMEQIRLLDIYFEDFKFHQLKAGQSGQIKLQINNKFEFAKSNDGKNLRTTIYTSIKDEDGRINLELKAVGIFLLVEAQADDPILTKIMVDSMWPFVRNEIQTLTIQPGMTPIILPLLAPFKPSEEKTIFA